MIPSWWLTGIYLFMAILLAATRKCGFKTQIKLGYVSSTFFVLGGFHEVWFGKLIIVQFVGFLIMVCGFYLGHGWEKMENEHTKHLKEMGILEKKAKDLKEEFRKQSIERLWQRRN